jgi:hypothetical protein
MPWRRSTTSSTSRPSANRLSCFSSYALGRRSVTTRVTVMVHRTGWSRQKGPLVLSHRVGLLYVS